MSENNTNNDMQRKLGVNLIQQALQEDKLKDPNNTALSPNNVRGIEFLGADGIKIVEHVSGGYSKSISSAMDDFDLNATNALTKEDIRSIFGNRKYGNLEYVHVADNMQIMGATGKPAAAGIAAVLKDITSSNGAPWYGRLHQVNGEEIPDTAGWENHKSLEPEAYAFDAKSQLGKKLNIETTPAPNTEATVPEPEKPTQEKTPQELELEQRVNKINSRFKIQINGAIDFLLEKFKMMFASGFDLLQPAGIPFPNDAGTVILHTVKDGKLTYAGEDVDEGFFLEIDRLYTNITDASGIQIAKARSHSEIINLAIKGVDVGQDARMGTPGRDLRVTLPYKMMEYAYGTQGAIAQNRVLTDEERKIYSPSGIQTWEEYSDKVIRRDLETLFSSLGYTALVNENMQDVYDVDRRSTREEQNKANEIIATHIETLQFMLASTIIIPLFQRMNNATIAIKARVLDNYTNWRKINQDQIRRAMKDLRISLENEGVNSYPPVYHGDAFSEYRIDLNATLANAEPVFAYKALQLLLAKGEKLTFENAPLGIDKDGNIVRNGSHFTLQEYLAHIVLAASRSGKGVWTSNVLAACIISARPIFYLDNKPDIGDKVADASKINGVPTAFVVNGGNLSRPKPESGTHFFKSWADADSWINPSHIPSYLPKELSIDPTKYAGRIGTLAYLRGMLLFLGIIAARVDYGEGEIYEKLGGENGIVGVFDEMAIFSNEFSALLRTLGEKYPNSKYWESYKQKPESVKDVAKPPTACYWSYLLVQAISETATKMFDLNNAGGKNGESRASDIFIISQDFFSLSDGSGTAERASMARRPNMLGSTKMNNTDNKGTTGSPTPLHQDIIFNMLMAFGGDAYLGVHDKVNHLGHHNKNSSTYNHINKSARCFGRVPYPVGDRKYTETQITNDRKDAVIYKPGLILANSDVVRGEGFDAEYTYFLRTVSTYIKDSGADLNSIISRNEDPIRKNTFHRATALSEYLEMAGVSREETAVRLSKSGDIAQFVVEALGYKGTWRDFLLDLRPQWIFSAKDIINALHPTHPKSLPASYTLDHAGEKSNIVQEIRTLYPDFFGDENSGFGSPVSGEGSEVDGNVVYIAGDGMYQNGVKVGGATEPVDSEDTESSEGMEAPEGEDYSDYDMEDVSYAEPAHESDEDILGEPEVDTETIPEEPIVEDIAAPIYENAKNSINADPDEWETANQPSEEYAETAPLEPVPQYSDGSTTDEYGDRVFGASTRAPEGYAGSDTDYRERAQQSQSFKNPPKHSKGFDLPPIGFDPYSIESFDKVYDTVTDAIIRAARGKNSQGIIALSIKDGDVIVNGLQVQVNTQPGDLMSMQDSLRNQLTTGKIGGLINWKKLITYMRSVEALEFSDLPDARAAAKAMFRDKDISVEHFFTRLRSLQLLTLVTKTYTRQDYREQLESTPQFYNRTAFERVEKKFREGTLFGASKSFAYARDRFRRKGGINKVVGVGAGAFGALLRSVSAASRASKGLANLGGRIAAANRMDQRSRGYSEGRDI